jgi:coproporphyrinogen III oxidase-like Fe-S oxidoreductase
VKRNVRVVPHSELIKDYFLTNLRRIEGISLRVFEHRFGQSLLTYLGSKLPPLIDQKFLTLSPSRLKVTRKGLYVLDSLLVELLT